MKWAIPLTLALLLLVSGCSMTSSPQVSPHKTIPGSDNDITSLDWQMPNFSFTDQSGQKFGMQDLQGKVWIADFMFTRCPNVCPPMTANMAKLQQALKANGVDAKLVSFSVDPDYDQPAVLKNFALHHHADLSNWHFLTGYSFEQIQAIGKDTFKGIFIQQKNPTPDIPILVNHPTQFYLIDGTGKLRKFYNGLQPDIDQIVKDTETVQSQQDAQSAK